MDSCVNITLKKSVLSVLHSAYTWHKIHTFASRSIHTHNSPYKAPNIPALDDVPRPKAQTNHHFIHETRNVHAAEITI